MARIIAHRAHSFTSQKKGESRATIARFFCTVSCGHALAESVARAAAANSRARLYTYAESGTLAA